MDNKLSKLDTRRQRSKPPVLGWRGCVLQVNWSVLAESILRNYTREVYLATKNGGWDGQLSHLSDVIEEESVVTSQWDMAGSLLFSVTVITTIGTPRS